MFQDYSWCVFSKGAFASVLHAIAILRFNFHFSLPLLSPGRSGFPSKRVWRRSGGVSDDIAGYMGYRIHSIHMAVWAVSGIALPVSSPSAAD